MFEKIEIKRDKNIKRLKIEVKEGGSLLISAPMFLSESKCIEFVEQNAKKLSKMIERQLSFEKKREELSGHFLYVGKKTKIDVDTALKCKYIFSQTGLTLSDSRHFSAFLLDEAKRIITPKLHDVASFYGVSFENVSFRDTKSRWGSCSAKRNLNFSTRLIGAPKSVIEYVVIHEVCHLKEPNHSKRFWEQVKILAPRYRESEQWLKENGRLLFIH